MEWKKVKPLPDWEFACPNNGVAGAAVKFRHPVENSNIPELLRFLRDMYSVKLKPSGWSSRAEGANIVVTVKELTGKNIGVLVEELPWHVVLTWIKDRKRGEEEKTTEAELLRQAALKIWDVESWSSLGELQNQLIEYQHLLCLAGFLKKPSGELDVDTWKAHLEFLTIGINKILGLSDKTDIESRNPESNWFIYWIQDALNLPTTGIYDLDTWKAVKQANKLTVVPVSGTPSDQLIELLIPWEALGLSKPTPQKIQQLLETDESEDALEPQDLLFAYLSNRAHGYNKGREDSAGHGALQAAEAFLGLYKKKNREEFLRKLDEFNKLAEKQQRTREEQTELKRRATELCKKVLNDPTLYADEAVFGKTVTSVVDVLGPESFEDLLMEYAFAAATAGVGVLIGRLMALRKLRKAKKALKAWKIGTARGSRKTGIIKRSGRFLEKMNKVQRVARGEKIIFTSDVKRGFDLVSYAGKGRKAKLFLDECKNWGNKFIRGKTYGKKKIPIGKFKTLLKKSEYQLSVKKAKDKLRGILKAGKIDNETYGALFHQLEGQTFTIRVVPGPDAEVTKKVMSELSEHFRKAKVVLDRSFAE